MRHVPPLDVDDPDLFDRIAGAKREPTRGLLCGVRNAVVGAYAAYALAAPEVSALTPVPLTPAEKKALLSAYSSTTTPFNIFRARLLRRVAAAVCPFCGIGESSTLDHYVPKEEQPEFAIFSKNLVPCCGPCNTRKGKLLADGQTNLRVFLHPYFDTVPDQEFLQLRVELLSDALRLTYGIVRVTGMPTQVFQQLVSHFTRLGLADRYRLMALAQLRDRYAALDRFYGSSKDAARVSDELLQDASDRTALHGRNDWQAVLYRTLGTNKEFCAGGFKVLKRVQ
jgi:hypothetical protein